MFFRCQSPFDEEEMKYLGSSGTIDIKELMPNDYKQLTNANFVIVPTKSLNSTRGPYYGWDSTSSTDRYVGRTVSASVSIAVNKSYNANTGILTCGITTNAGAVPFNVYFYRKNS